MSKPLAHSISVCQPLSLSLCISLSIYINIYIKPFLVRYVFININRLIGLIFIMFDNGLEDLGSIQGRVIPKTQKLYSIPP